MKTWMKVERAKRDMSQSDLAKVMKVSRQTINSIECDRFTPSVILALRIAKYFEKTVDEMFFLEEHDEPE